jgi:molybdopterin converting factor small subunit
MMEVRIALPAHLRTLARVGDEVRVDVADPVTVDSAIDALEAAYPALLGTIREHGTGKRRAFLRYFADGRDLSHESTDTPLPDGVVSGDDVFCVIGAISGG